MTFGHGFGIFGAGLLSGLAAAFVAVRCGFAVAAGRMTERRANSAVLITAGVVAFVGALLAGCPDNEPRWPEQHHAGAR